MLLLNASAELLVTLWLHYEDDVSEAPFYQYFFREQYFKSHLPHWLKSEETYKTSRFPYFLPS